MAISPSTSKSSSYDCIVVGAGVAGVCAALSIQETRAKVAIVERDEPGYGASFGNAGIVVNTKLTPVFAGLTPSVLFSMLRNPASPLNVRWSRSPGMMPWFLRMLSHAGPQEVDRITRALATLCRPGAGHYAPLWDEAGLGDLVVAKGNLALNRSAEERDANWEKSAALRNMGVPMEKIDGADIRRMAPTVSADYTHGVYSPDFQHTLDPQQFVERLFTLFARRGGTTLRGTVTDLVYGERGIAGVQTKDGTIDAGSVVIAAGTDSAALAAHAGEAVPHQAVGGYHVMLGEPGLDLAMPILPIDFRFAITPMRHGVRLAGIYEFGGEKLPFKQSLIDNMLTHVGKVLPGINPKASSVWRGYRSYLPDGLPIISASSRHDNLFYLFGLSSAGMINGATAGRTMAQIWQGTKPELDVQPFSIERFARHHSAA